MIPDVIDIKPPTIEEFLSEFLKRPGAFITPAELIFIANMREAAKQGVGYGWMKQFIDLEWNSLS